MPIENGADLDAHKKDDKEVERKDPTDLGCAVVDKLMCRKV